MSTVLPLSERVQQLIVRMCFDNLFVAQVRSDEVLDLGIGERERQWLRELPQEALDADAERRARLVMALRQEAPLATRMLDLVKHWPYFFGSPEFAAVIEQRGSSVVALCDFVERTFPVSGWTPVLRVEACMARLRRKKARALAPDDVALGERFSSCVVPAQTLVAYEHKLQLLGASEDSPREVILAERSPSGEISLEIASEGIGAIVSALGEGVLPKTQVLAILAAHTDEPDNVLLDLLADGLLVA